MKLQFKDIIIPKYFSPPSERKLEKCREAYNRGELDRDLVVDGKHVLRDGYVLYTVLKEHEYDGEVEVKSVGNQFYNRPTTYVFGKHMGGDDTERVWYINMSYDKVKNTIGRLADVDTKHGIQTITITKVERLSNPPYDGVIRKVVHI
jgi:hypothetical protein